MTSTPRSHLSQHSSTLSRRTAVRLAATGAVGLAGASLIGVGSASAAPAAAPAFRSCGRTPRPGDTAHVTVTATTVWVEPRTNRPGIDDPAVSTPVDLDAWNANMQDTETRRWLTGKLETQAVLGSEVIVDEVDGDWAKIVVTAQPTPRDERGYPGWVPLAHLVVDRDFARLAKRASRATVTALTSPLELCGHDAVISVSFDTILPVTRMRRRNIEVAVPGAGRGLIGRDQVVVRAREEAGPPPTVEAIIATGERFLGLRYLWGGVSAYGFDCSGFTYTLLHHAGVTMARDAGPQMNASGFDPVEREDLQRGDLVFFLTKPGATSIRHVAVYLGDDLILQAPNAARSVEIMSLTEYDTAGDYAGARRIPILT